MMKAIPRLSIGLSLFSLVPHVPFLLQMTLNHHS